MPIRKTPSAVTSRPPPAEAAPRSSGSRSTPATAAPTAAQLQRRLEAFIPDAPLSKEAGESLRSLQAHERRMYGATLDALASLKKGELTPAKYMVHVMRQAAELSKGDAGRFVSLVHMAFNEDDRGDYGTRWKRELVQGGWHPAGAELERIYKSLTGRQNDPSGGFSAHLVDSQDATSTVTHHFAELFKVSYSLGATAGKFITEKVDEKSVNPGDVRNGYFAAMLGGGLRAGKLSPDQAVALVEWAYLQPPHLGPTPFQTKPASFLDRGDFELDRWARALEQASPDFSYRPPPLWKRLLFGGR